MLPSQTSETRKGNKARRTGRPLKASPCYVAASLFRHINVPNAISWPPPNLSPEGTAEWGDCVQRDGSSRSNLSQHVRFK